MQSLKGGTEAIAHLDQLEADYYDLQLQLYEVQFEILKYEELLLTAQLESIRRLMSGGLCILINTSSVEDNSLPKNLVKPAGMKWEQFLYHIELNFLTYC